MKLKNALKFIGIFMALFICLCFMAHSRAAIDRHIVTGAHQWQKIEFHYYQNFPWKKAYEHSKNHACTKKYSVNRQPFLSCQASTYLLRPADTANPRQYSKTGQRYGPGAIKMPHRHTTAVTPAEKLSLSRQVTGLFITWALNVKSYTFRNTVTGAITRINATPSHPFYVLNKKKFLPVKEVFPSDRLITSKGESVVPVCPAGRHNHCGKVYAHGAPVPVYNLEVYDKHQYFAGQTSVLVHNCMSEDELVEQHAPRHKSRGHLLPQSADDPSLTILRALKDQYFSDSDLSRTVTGVFYQTDPRPMSEVFREGFQSYEVNSLRYQGAYATANIDDMLSAQALEEGTHDEPLVKIFLIDLRDKITTFHARRQNGFYQLPSVNSKDIAGCLVYAYEANKKNRQAPVSLDKFIMNLNYTGDMRIASLLDPPHTHLN